MTGKQCEVMSSLNLYDSRFNIGHSVVWFWENVSIHVALVYCMKRSTLVGVYMDSININKQIVNSAIILRGNCLDLPQAPF